MGKEQTKIKMQFTELEKSINFCFDIFGQKQAFSKWENGDYNNRFNRALFEVKFVKQILLLWIVLVILQKN